MHIVLFDHTGNFSELTRIFMFELREDDKYRYDDALHTYSVPGLRIH